MTWISIDTPPDDRRDIIVGHDKGQWVEKHVRRIDGHYRLRQIYNRDGDIAFKQPDTKRPDGTPAPPSEWLWGAEVFPTHWQYDPLPPAERKEVFGCIELSQPNSLIQ